MDQTETSGMLGMTERWKVNVSIATLSFVVAALGSLLPFVLFGRPQGTSARGQQPRYNLALSIGNMLSAGVMLSAALVHLLAESFEELEHFIPSNHSGGTYPWAMVLCGVGFITTLIAAQLLEPGSGETTCEDCVPHCQLNTATTPSPSSALLAKGMSGAFEHHAWHNLELDHSGCGHSPANGSLHQHEHCDNGHDHSHATGNTGQPSEHVLSDPLLSFPEPQLEPLGNVGSAVLAIGLAIHALIEGAAVGAQDTTSKALNVAAAVLAHKGLTAYAVGSSLFTARATKRQCIVYMLVFCLSTPIGITLGSFLAIEVKGAMWAPAISAVASGTFMYSSVVEVLGNELRQDCYELDSVHRTTVAKMAKLAAFIIGFALMSWISNYT